MIIACGIHSWLTKFLGFILERELARIVRASHTLLIGYSYNTSTTLPFLLAFTLHLVDVLHINSSLNAVRGLTTSSTRKKNITQV